MDSKKKALKVLFKLGLLRGSLPNLLAVVSLLQQQHLSLDLGTEVNLLKSESPEGSIMFNKLSLTKLFFSSAINPKDPVPERNYSIGFTTDGKYIYLHSEAEGLMKIGTGFSYTMLGKVYIHKKNYRLKERASLCFILGKLYYRSGKIAPLPLIEIDPETLEECKATVDYQTGIPNCLFAEMTNSEIEFPHITPNDEDEETDVKNLMEVKKIGEKSP